ncbi:cytochrome C peroxidase [Flavipsychrobacter stenotrophus]|uniref:Cytochrome C peroxidase n=1 Tax=Flavipsychrobacter stenotrophus TaxID=2077091 RepID=A0A2S7SSP2_9BACT|nr:cytochrome c peroxidase [Flavipsychrobacter stenotrophus]PQJ09625.1 cytochrome C peroxidase [Flavipsychrobacter stenotrophus]
MIKCYLVTICLALAASLLISFKDNGSADYLSAYNSAIAQVQVTQKQLIAGIGASDINSENGKREVRNKIEDARNAMKAADIWLRYLEPQAYRRINGPLPVEWETEVFEKFEKPYKREGTGLTLATLYLDEEKPVKDSLLSLIQSSLSATSVYSANSITGELQTYHHFYLCNRLWLLNLAAIYTTGFECPDPTLVIPELRIMLSANRNIYTAFNASFPATPITADYLSLYGRMNEFVNTQPHDINHFDHFKFIRDYVNPLFIINQQLIARYHVVSHSLVDYSLNKNAVSVFDKNLYPGQNSKGVFIRVTNDSVLAEIEQVGKLLFHDPILSGNNMRTCASCHKPGQFFTDTAFATSLHYNRVDRLARNSPTLLNSSYNHLVMLDGKHSNLQDQTKAVISNPDEMGCSEKEVLRKVLSCKQYSHIFCKLLTYTPAEKEITYDHIVSAITWYYSQFSRQSAPFDGAMNKARNVSQSIQSGFNLFMGKAQCATCHFVPQFNGVKPPYVGSEFEVIGVPETISYLSLSKDKGRYVMNPAKETMNAFRTGTVRNSAHTMPYMHNGVFTTMEQVIDFYDGGGGNGHGLNVANQTLSADSLKLTPVEKKDLIAFINSLNEEIPTEIAPVSLPKSRVKALNSRKVGGIY